ncbi:MAG TPA: nuclear transport factor 2 family protein [Croceibacterium sp.]|nr:nuclear transport factor 2 family protein [Croceibacterium sp.]
MAPMASRLSIAEQMIAHYNAQDADAYVALMTDDACEAGYRGAVLRDGREGVREGLNKMFAEFPENRADVLWSRELGDNVVFHERVQRSAAADPFDVVAVYSFDGDKCSRVEFIR